MHYPQGILDSSVSLERQFLIRKLGALKIFCWIFLFAALGVSSAKGQQAEVKTWIALNQLDTNAVSVAPIVKNLSSNERQLSYVFKVSVLEDSSPVYNTQQGEATVSGFATLRLSSLQLQVAQDQRVVLSFSLFEKNRLIEALVTTSTLDSLIYAEGIRSENVNVNLENKPVVQLGRVSDQSQALDSAPIEGLEIDGLIIDETRSKIGRDFYDQFYSNWEAPAGATNYAIIFKEYPTRGRVARIGIEINGNLIVQPVVQPRLELIEMVANQSIQVVKKHLLEQKKINIQMENEDQSGSGLF